MGREHIRRAAIKKMSDIEDRFSDYVPPPVQSYYLLMSLLVSGVEKYLKTYGLQMLDVHTCEEGKEMSGCTSELTPFEADCVEYLNEVVERHELAANQKRVGHQHGTVVGITGIRR